MTNLFAQHSPGDILPSSDWNNNWILTQNSLSDLGPYAISGLTLAAGAGLAVTVAAGVASIGGRITAASSFSIAGLADATTNHLYLRDDGTGTSNTSGTQPADTVKLGTATTSGGVVTSTSILRSSGRQQKVRTEALVHGGSAGNPRAVDLAQWAAATDSPNEVKGTLPAGAMPAIAFDDLSDVTLTSQARGDIVYRNASVWVNLAAGTSGRFLKTNGAGADPAWASISGVLALDDLTDVNLPSASQGDVLYRNATEWVRLAAGTSGQFLETLGAGANPVWASLPAETDTLATLTDVTLSGTAQGDLLYRGASVWNNLGAGTSGQFLKTQGAGANPVWSGLSSTDLAPAVILAPGSNTRNLVQSTGNFNNLVLRGFAGQTNMLTQWEDSTTAIVANITPAGLLTTRTATVQPLADVAGAFQVNNAAGTAQLQFNTDGSQPGLAVARNALLLSAASRYRAIDGSTTISDNAPAVNAGFASFNAAALYSGTGTLTNLWGAFYTVRNTGTGTVTNNYGIYVGNNNTSTGTVTTNYGGRFDSPTNAGTIVNSLGVEINDQSLAGMTLAVGLRIRSQSANATSTYALWSQGGLCEIDTGQAATKGLIIKGSASQSANLFECQNSSAVVLASVGPGGVITHLLSDATTNVISDELILDHTSSGTPAAGFGQAIRYRSKSSTTASRDVAVFSSAWATATDASRMGRARLWACDASGTDRECIRIESDGTNAMVGFLGSAAVARPAAYTQTYATATRTHANVTSAAVATTAAALASYGYTQAQADSIPVAINAIAADLLNLKQLVNSLIDDLQANGLLA